MTATEWNDQFPIGTRVRYWPIIGSPGYTDHETRSEAWELGHGIAVVSLTGKSGGMALSHLHVLELPSG